MALPISNCPCSCLQPRGRLLEYLSFPMATQIRKYQSYRAEFPSCEALYCRSTRNSSFTFVSRIWMNCTSQECASLIPGDCCCFVWSRNFPETKLGVWHCQWPSLPLVRMSQLVPHSLWTVWSLSWNWCGFAPSPNCFLHQDYEC